MQWLKNLFKGAGQPDNAPPAPSPSTPLLPAEWQMPVAGDIIALADVADPAFSQGMMGQGFAIRAASGTIASPVNGRIEAVFPGGHAIGITADNGAEMLIHVGIDSVNLKGEGFAVQCQQETPVRIGDKLVDVDFALLQSRLPDSAVIIVFPEITDGEIVVRDGRPVWQAKDSA